MFMFNGRNSFQLFVGVPGTCLVWFLLVLPPSAHAAASMTSLKAADGSTSYHSREYISLGKLANCASYDGGTYVRRVLQSDMIKCRTGKGPKPGNSPYLSLMWLYSAAAYSLSISCDILSGRPVRIPCTMGILLGLFLRPLA